MIPIKGKQEEYVNFFRTLRAKGIFSLQFQLMIEQKAPKYDFLLLALLFPCVTVMF